MLLDLNWYNVTMAIPDLTFVAEYCLFYEMKVSLITLNSIVLVTPLYHDEGAYVLFRASISLTKVFFVVQIPTQEAPTYARSFGTSV